MKPLFRLWLWIVPAVVAADVNVAAFFCDHAVLQRDKPIPVWGTGSSGEPLRVRFGDQEVRTSVDAAGTWCVYLAPERASGQARDLVVEASNRIVVRDVLVGEVWLCSGQSNMAWTVAKSANAAAEIATAQLSLIREFAVPRRTLETPTLSLSGTWRVCSPQTVGDFSAVAYYFARDLFQHTDIPVGLIHASWGGTPIEAWLSKDALEASGAIAEVDAHWKEFSRRKKSSGVANDEPLKRRPTGLFNAMIRPLAPYAVCGVIWYQGEANARRAHYYAPLFQSLIRDWRRTFAQGDLPFYWVQLANFRPSNAPEMAWAELRASQDQALVLPNTGQAIAIDVGEVDNIHPRNKQAIGARLALIARAGVHGHDVCWRGPTFARASVDGRELRLEFSHCAGGLRIRGDSLRGFEIAGGNGQFRAAEARIEGNTVVVHAPDVRDPVAVRYAWSNAPEATLCNDTGLPAAPFRTDGLRR